MVAEADQDKLGRRESGVRPWREGAQGRAESCGAKKVVAKKKNTLRSGTTMAKQRDQIPESVAAETKKKLDEYLALETNEVRLSLILK